MSFMYEVGPPVSAGVKLLIWRRFEIPHSRGCGRLILSQFTLQQDGPRWSAMPSERAHSPSGDAECERLRPCGNDRSPRGPGSWAPVRDFEGASTKGTLEPVTVGSDKVEDAAAEFARSVQIVSPLPDQTSLI
jgi:hypothetical protein